MIELRRSLVRIFGRVSLFGGVWKAKVLRGLAVQFQVVDHLQDLILDELCLVRQLH